MNREDLTLRETVIDKRPDVTDPDNWPDIAPLPGRLLPVLDVLDAQISVARSTGQSTDRLTLYRDALWEAREAIIRLAQMSPLEAWRLLHPPQLDPLDGIHDCGNPNCPVAGFIDAEDRSMHQRRWRLP